MIVKSAGFAATTVFSAAPIACGPYAVRVRLVPSADNGPGMKGPQDDWNVDFAGRLRRQHALGDRPGTGFFFSRGQVSL